MSEPTGLTLRDPVLLKLEAARQYLAEATDLAEVKHIHDVAASAEVYARRQQLGEEAIGFAHRVKTDALARLGELLADMPKNVGAVPGKTGTKGVPVLDPTPTLADLGISKKVSSVAQQLAALPPDLREAVAGREKSLTEVRRTAKAEEIATRPASAWPTGKYRIIYADPPWKYADNLTPSYGAVRFHYPPMGIADLCALPVQDLALDDAVLFLWVTSPILEESFSVIRAWGFRYKASFVWDKVKHNMGHYNSVRHEFLLIATRGSCPPDVARLHDSVQTIERTAHSEKPEAFRAIIDEIYPAGPRVELFARGRAAGWEVYGNEL